MVKVLAGARYGEILGVHAAGDGASEFIVAGHGDDGNGNVRSESDEIVFPHPTVSEALKRPSYRSA